MPDATTYLSRREFATASLALGTLLAGPAWAAPADAKTEARVRDLIARMTIVEKAGQLTIMNAAFKLPNEIEANAGSPVARADEAREIEAGRMGGIFNGFGASWAKGVQDAAMRSRLKIPLLIAADVIHGMNTVFPVPLAEASAFDADLAMRTARAAAIEASAVGIAWTFAPMVDIARDARWGRMVEGSGEDVVLGGLLAAARVKGFQGASLADPGSVIACAKHFAAYGAAEGGRDYGAADISIKSLREVYLPPFRAASDAGCRTMMAAFNEIGGVPCTGNRELLEDILRGEWKFDGFVVSDWNGDLEMVAHGFAKDARDAARIAIMAGCDMSMRSWLYRDHLPDLVATGEVPMARVDECVARVLRVKFALGLFDDPYNRISAAREKRFAKPQAHRALALEAAHKSMVLLRNEGNVLPLAKDRKIALIGPLGDTGDVNGAWTFFTGPGEPLAPAIRRAMAKPDLLTVVKGSDIDQPIDGGIAAAVAAARAADVVLLAIGESSDMSGEARSRHAVTVPAAQQALAAAVAATGKPVVVLLRCGRGLALDGAVRDADAILVTWHLGTCHADAIADMVFGTVAPTGRLPVSFPRTPGQVPVFYAQHPTGRPADADEMTPYSTGYWDTGTRPLYAFGHGLTYGDVRYEAVAIDRATIAPGGRVRAVARVKNYGSRAAEETVQLYVTKPGGLTTKPRKQLVAFRKVLLAPGEASDVGFDLDTRDLAEVMVGTAPRLLTGKAKVWIAGSARDSLSASVEVTA